MDFTKKNERERSQTYCLFEKERYSRIRSPVKSPRRVEDNLLVLLGTLQMQWQRLSRLCHQMAQIGSNTTTWKLNTGVQFYLFL